MGDNNKEQLVDIVKPHDHDVLSGRGNYVNHHAGNENFRKLWVKHIFEVMGLRLIYFYCVHIMFVSYTNFHLIIQILLIEIHMHLLYHFLMYSVRSHKVAYVACRKFRLHVLCSFFFCNNMLSSVRFNPTPIQYQHT